MKEFTESRLALGAGELWDLGTRAEFLNVERYFTDFCNGRYVNDVQIH